MTNTKIVLTMIVKDEEHVIERALNSCYEMIDSYCIVDTGSTDKTKEIIKTFFDSKGIDGKIVDFEFTNFEECRNQSIEHAKDLGKYGFWMDADEELVLDKTFNKQILNAFIQSNKPDQMLIQCEYGGMKYQRAQFYRFDNDYYWYGPVHEVLQSKNHSKNVKFDLGHMFITPDGNSWQAEDIAVKYEEHAEILLKYQDDNDWQDPRWTFYLAQSYRDAANIVLSKDEKDERGLKLCRKAIQYYTERTKVKTHFIEEIYYSQLMIARLSYHINTQEFIFQHLLKCEELNVSNRVEHIFNMASFLQSNDSHKNALIYLTLAMKYIKEGLKGELFVEPFMYEWGIYDMYGVSLYYTGQKEKALKYFKYALKKAKNYGNAGNTDIKRMSNNVESTDHELQQLNSQNGKGSINI